MEAFVFFNLCAAAGLFFFVFFFLRLLYIVVVPCTYFNCAFSSVIQFVPIHRSRLEPKNGFRFKERAGERERKNF